MFMTEETLIEYLIKIVSSRSVIKDVFWDITGSLAIAKVLQRVFIFIKVNNRNTQIMF